MTRLRLALAGLALALAVPGALLVSRALASVELERRVGQEAVAARVFDEMERALSDFLEREEARPFAGYAAPDGAPGGPGDEGDAPFVVARFQVDPGGAVHVSLPGHAGDALAESVRAAWPAPGGAASAATPGAPSETAGEAATQAPGTTVPLGKLRTAATAPATESRAKASAERKAGTAYEVLDSLNRAVEEREQRQVAKLEERVPALRSAPTSPARVAPPHAEPSAEEGRAARDRAAEAERPARPGPAAPRPAEHEPLIARPAGPGRLLLYRTVLRADGGYRQGVVVDRARLVDWLDERVLRASGLAELASAQVVALGDRSSVPSEDAGRYQHRFAEPFDAWAVRLSLAPLPGLGDPTPVWGLALLLAAVGAGGLLAVHRMVSARVHFALRRQNFVAAVTHELKTPLTAIRMYAEMLRDGLVDSDERRERYYRTLTEESERLSRLIDNVLEFSRLERGAREMVFVVGDLAPVVAEAAQKLRPHAERHGFELCLDVEPGLPPVRFDRDALLQILFNLVDNALKYAASAARRQIRIECRRHPDGRRVVVAVRDFGPGVGRAHLARVFEPFYRSGDELTRSAAGSGIGLALVKDLGERMGAAVSGANGDDGGFRVGLVFEAAAPGTGPG